MRLASWFPDQCTCQTGFKLKKYPDRENDTEKKKCLMAASQELGFSVGREKDAVF